MKKSQMLKFLFWTIVGLALFIPACALGSKFFKLGDNSIKSYTSLVEAMDSIREDETASTGVSMNKKSVIVGFSKDANRFENHQYASGRESVAFFFERPESCEEQKACICLCQDYTFKVGGNKPYSSECKEAICSSFGSIDIVSEKIVSRYGNGNPKFSWKGGFLFLRDVPAIANGLGEQNRQETRTFYVQRYKNVVGVCIVSPCIPENIKAQLDAS